MALRSGWCADFFTLSLLKGCDLQFSPLVTDEFGPQFWETHYPVEAYFDMARFGPVYRELVKISAAARTRLQLIPHFAPERGEAELAILERFFTHGNEIPITESTTPATPPGRTSVSCPTAT